MRRPTAIAASPNLLEGEKAYLKRAKIALPILVRQAKAGQTIFYSDLAQEIGISNPRNLNFILGAIGNALIKLGKEKSVEIPQIQCLVINKTNRLPGEGIKDFIKDAEFNKLTNSQKRDLVNRLFIDIYSFQKWDWVLKQFNLKPINLDLNVLIEKSKKKIRKGGESRQHKEFKNYVSENPSKIGLPDNLNAGVVEYILPSTDTVDVLFKDKDLYIGVEVKSRISDTNDIFRGLFQCLKYKYLIEAEQIVNDKKPNSRVILAIEGIFPEELNAVKNLLGIEVVDNINKHGK